MPRQNYLFTSESVSEGHPDKVCDRVSDSIVDLFLGAEPDARVACETLTTTNLIVLAGEVRGPASITKDLIEDGKQHLMLADGLDVPCPVRILQGEDDPDVPWQHGLKTYHALRGDDVVFEMVKGGDHRLSTERDLTLLTHTVDSLCRMADGDS